MSLLDVSPISGDGTVVATSVGGEGVHLTTDFGASWENVTMGGITHPWGDEIKINPNRPDNFWYIADVGEVFQSENRGEKWTRTINPYSEGYRHASTYASLASIGTSGGRSQLIHIGIRL